MKKLGESGFEIPCVVAGTGKRLLARVVHCLGLLDFGTGVAMGKLPVRSWAGVAREGGCAKIEVRICEFVQRAL